MSTQDLIAKCKRNDRKAQLALYKMYCDGMFVIAKRYMHSYEAAEDAMQDAFVKAFKNLSQYKEEVQFGAWLKKIVINQCLDALKIKQLDVVSTEEAAFEMIEEDSWNVDVGTVEQVKLSIQQLPENYKTVVQLFLIEGYDHNEIATFLGISENTSRSLLFRGKKKIQEQLKAVSNGTRS